MMINNYPVIYGLGGDSLMAPGHTQTAFWAALAGGASGFVSGVRLTKDRAVICYNYDNLNVATESNAAVCDLGLDDIRKLDAGYRFRSTALNAEGQPTGQRGEDKPWKYDRHKRRVQRIPLLDDMLKLFARRTQVILQIPANSEGLARETLNLLKQNGVLNRVIILTDVNTCKLIRDKHKNARLAMIFSSDEDITEQIHKALELATESIYVDWSLACVEKDGVLQLTPEIEKLLTSNSYDLLLGSEEMPYAPLPEYAEAITPILKHCSIISKGVIPTVEIFTPPVLILSDNFSGNNIDTTKWSAGYSHINQDTEIFQNNGLNIKIKDGGSYSGAAAACILPVHGRFDAQVNFHVSNPQQGTTFEMAAICIDPGYFKIDNSGLNTRNVNLTFDVHGAPPYASSERDEDDGFRCGWNNSFNLTKVAQDWEADSVNMYNKYGGDVGEGGVDNASGTLRLLRNGAVFATYYKDKYNDAWVCSGTMLVQNMADDIFVRLAAKHWNKGGNPAPGNHVIFRNFKLYQF